MQLDVSSVPGITLRPREEEDRAFLSEVYASTRLEELAVTGWTREQTSAFLTFQFDAQDRHYTEHYKTCSFYVIEHDGSPCGRLYVDTWATEVRIVDIAFLPQRRGIGLGTRLIEAIIAYATSRALPVSIHVEKENPALRLYERLGFEKIEERGAHFLMKRPFKS